MHKLLELLLHNQNAFASGGLLLMVVGGIAAALRSVPLRLWGWLTHQTTMSMTIIDNCDAFQWFKEWYTQQPHAQKSRRVDVFTQYNQSLFSPAPGRHWFFYKRRPIWVYFSRSEEKKGNSYTNARAESFTITTLGRDQQFLRNMITDIQEGHKSKHAEKPKLYTWSDSYWSRAQSYEPRSMESVILPKDQKERVIHDIERFMASHNWYESLGIPYHRGYLFYGPPGTGKTSLVTALSSKFRNSVYLLKLNQHDDNSLLDAVRSCTDNSFIVFEDVDCVQGVPKDRDQTDATKQDKLAEKFGVSLSGLLNVIDGMESPSGVMFCMTTNKIDKLDPALLRPGRVDVREFIGEATTDQKVELFARFFPGECAADTLANSTAKTMAEFQGELLIERNRRLQEAQ